MANGVALRDGKKEAMWRRHVRGQSSECLSVRAYCAAHGLREYSFYWWRRELSRRDAEPSPAFVPVTVAVQTPASTGEGRIEIVLAGNGRGRHVRVVGPVDRQRLADVLAVLEDRAGRREEARC
jgi:hypothetical protein